MFDLITCCRFLKMTFWNPRVKKRMNNEEGDLRWAGPSHAADGLTFFAGGVE